MARRTYEQIMAQIHEEAKHMCLSPYEMAAWEEQAIDAARAEAEQEVVRYKVLCDTCNQRYEQNPPRPQVCGACGSSNILVGEVSDANH